MSAENDPINIDNYDSCGVNSVSILIVFMRRIEKFGIKKGCSNHSPQQLPND